MDVPGGMFGIRLNRNVYTLGMSQPIPVVVLMVQRSTFSKAIPVAMLILLVLSVVPIPGLAVEVSDEMEIDTNDNDIIQRVDGDSAGNFHVIYTSDEPDGDYRDLMYKKIDPTGSTMVDSIKLTPSNMDGNVGNTAIAVDDAGRAHVTMVIRTDNMDYYGVVYAQVGADGNVAVSAKKVYEDNDPTRPNGIDIETDSAGNAYIVWHQTTDPPTIMWAKVSPAGSISKQAKEISGDLQFGGTVAYPRLGVSNNGDNLIVWQQKTNQVSRTSIWFTKLTPTGTVDVDPSQVVSSPLTDLTNLEATTHVSQSELHVVYMEGNDAQYAMIDRDGDVLETRTIYSDLVGEAASPDVAVAKNGDVFISYGARSPALTGSWDLFAQVYWYADDEWDGPEQVNGNSAPGFFGRPAATNNGGAVFFGRSNNLQMVMLTQEAANRPPVPDLAFSPQDPGVGEVVTFDGRDSTDPDDEGYVDEYNFVFGDGATSGWVTTSSVIHSYSSAGTYTARLRVRDDQGLESTGEDSVSVTVKSTTSNKAPTAVLSADKTNPDKGEEVTFSGASSFDTDGVVSDYLFTFGDGVNSGWVPTATVKHSYSKEGAFTATLKVRDDDGAESPLDTTQITVVDTNEAPTALIESITPNPAMQGDDITFVGSGTDPDGTIQIYSWESSMGGIIGSQATEVTQLDVGTHIITFKVKDNDGVWSADVTRTLIVKANTVFSLNDQTKIPSDLYPDKLVEFRVVYTDADNDPPTQMNLLYSKGNDWKTETLGEVNPADTNYRDGKEYYFNKKFDTGDWNYKFEFKNAQHAAKATTEVTFKVQEAGGLPGPGAGIVIGAVVLATIVASVTLRGRKRQD